MKNITRNSNKKKDDGYFNRETFGMITVLFSLVVFLLLLIGDAVFDREVAVSRFLLGVFGYCIFPILIFTAALGVKLVIGGQKVKKLFSISKLCAAFSVLFAVLLLHTLTSSRSTTNFNSYISACYNSGFGGVATATFGGAFFAIFNYLFLKLFGWTINIIFCALMIVMGIFCSYKTAVSAANSKKKTQSTYRAKKTPAIIGYKEYPATDFVFNKEEKQEIVKSKKLFGATDGEFELKTKKDLKNEKEEFLNILYSGKIKDKVVNENTKSSFFGTSTGDMRSEVQNRASYRDSFDSEYNQKLNYIKIPPTINTKIPPVQPLRKVANPIVPETRRTTETDRTEHEIKSNYPLNGLRFSENKNLREDRSEDLFDTNVENLAEQNDAIENDLTSIQNAHEASKNTRETSTIQNLYQFKNTEKPQSQTEQFKPNSIPIQYDSGNAENSGPINKEQNIPLSETIDSQIKPLKAKDVEQVSFESIIETQKFENIPGMPKKYRYNAPPMDLFKVYKPHEVDDSEYYESCARTIKETLESFDVSCEVVNIVKGPTVTRFELSLPYNISVTKVPPKERDLAMRLATESVRIEAPIPGKSLVGIEVANKTSTIVGLREVLESPSFYQGNMDKLVFALGVDVVGKPMTANLINAPHLLVAGSTGMGKSVFLNTMLISLIKKYSPEDLRLILVDPKQVEFTLYESIPHLLFDQILTDTNRIIAMLNWAINEMERRYAILRSNAVQKIEDYNNSVAGKGPKMFKIVIVIDEFGDLLSTNKNEINERIRRLTQKARAAGIYLVCATQRPSVDVITGAIKTNLPSRVAFRVTNYEDSRTILGGEGGAEKLLGNGDMLYKDSKMPKPQRIQGAYISNSEILDVVKYVKENNEGIFDESANNFINTTAQKTQSSDGFDESTGDSGEQTSESGGTPKYYIDALRIICKMQAASISMIQRRLGLGFNRAAKAIDWMVDMGYVPEQDTMSSKKRVPNLTYEKFLELYGDLDDADDGDDDL